MAWNCNRCTRKFEAIDAIMAGGTPPLPRANISWGPLHSMFRGSEEVPAASSHEGPMAKVKAEPGVFRHNLAAFSSISVDLCSPPKKKIRAGEPTTAPARTHTEPTIKVKEHHSDTLSTRAVKVEPVEPVPTEPPLAAVVDLVSDEEEIAEPIPDPMDDLSQELQAEMDRIMDEENRTAWPQICRHRTMRMVTAGL